jgi:E1-E2 ATPase
VLWRGWPGIRPPLLALTTAALAAGLVLHAAGAGGVGDTAWAAAGVCGAGYALWAMGDTLRRGRVGVDVIALPALAGALAVGELLAAAVISVMLASDGALEAWAAGRARRDLRALLERVPRTAHRYRGRALETVPLDAVAPGDLLMVAPGELVPVDGTVAGAAAVLDESALTGEARPVERSARDPVRSGVVSSCVPPQMPSECSRQPRRWAASGGCTGSWWRRSARMRWRSRRSSTQPWTGSGRQLPTATMSRAHAEIAHQTRRLGQLIDDVGPGPPDQADIADLRALLYGLHAILRLHTAQEDESYLSLGDAPVPQPRGAPVPPALTAPLSHSGSPPPVTPDRPAPGAGYRSCSVGRISISLTATCRGRVTM